MSQVIDLAANLIRFESTNPPGLEAGVIEYTRQYMESRGISCSIYEKAAGRPILVTRLDGAHPRTIVFNGHCDVVPAGDGWDTPPFEPAIRDGRLYGRGSCDMKGGLAAMLCAQLSLSEIPPEDRPNVEVHVVPDEEDHGENGSKYLAETGLARGDVAVFGEPTDLNVVRAHKGQLSFRVVYSGKAAHASTPELGENAITKAVEALAGIESRFHKMHEGFEHPLLGRPTMSIGKIDGGAAGNIVPERCVVLIDRRVVPGETMEAAIAEMRALAGDCGHVELVGEDGYGEVGEDSYVVALAKRAVTDVIGAEPAVKGMRATTDAHWYIDVARIPSVILGPGNIDLAHQANEWVEVAQIEQAVDVYVRMALLMVDG